MRNLYAFEDSAISGKSAGLSGLRNVQVEDGPAVAADLPFTAHGIEFAHALHLSGRPEDCL